MDFLEAGSALDFRVDNETVLHKSLCPNSSRISSSLSWWETREETHFGEATFFHLAQWTQHYNRKINSLRQRLQNNNHSPSCRCLRTNCFHFTRRGRHSCHGRRSARILINYSRTFLNRLFQCHLFISHFLNTTVHWAQLLEKILFIIQTGASRWINPTVGRRTFSNNKVEGALSHKVWLN